ISRGLYRNRSADREIGATPMAVALEQHTFRQDVLQHLRTLAAQGAGLAEMVSYVQKELGFSHDFIVLVLGYFCHAFSLPLRTVLPLREWCETRDDREVAPLLERIRNAVAPASDTVTKR